MPTLTKVLVDIFAVVLGVLIMGFIIWLANVCAAQSCYQTASKIGLKGDYSFFSGCIVEENDRKFPLGEYRIFRNINEVVE